MTLPLRLYVAGFAEKRMRMSRSNWIWIAADLDGTSHQLFEDVEQADLHEFVEFRHLVHGEDAAVHARDEAKMQGILGGHARTRSELGRIDLADDIRELGPWSEEALGASAARRAATRRSARAPPAFRQGSVYRGR